MTSPGPPAVRGGNQTKHPHMNLDASKKNILEDVFDECVGEFLDKNRHHVDDPIDSALWEELLYHQAGCESDEQIFDPTTDFVDRGKRDEADLCEDLLYGCSK